MEMFVQLCMWAGVVLDVCLTLTLITLAMGFPVCLFVIAFCYDEIYNADRLDDELYNDALTRLYLQHLRTRFAVEHNCKTLNHLAAQAA